MSSETRRVSFKNGSIDVAADLRLPDGFDERKTYSSLVVVTPGSSVKEQIGANYATRMTDRGFVTLAFDPSYQGQSGGQPRDLEDPAVRMEDVRCAVDFLLTLSYIDEARLGVLGVCAGGGYTAAVSMTEHRIKAVGVVVPVNLGRALRQGVPGDPDGVEKMLLAVGAARTAEARSGEQQRENWLPDTQEEAEAANITDREVLDAIEFYRTPRGFSEYSTNRRYVPSDGPLLAFDAFNLAGELLTQPLQVIIGGRKGTTGSYDDGMLLWERARNKEDLLIINGAGHYDMYDKPEYVDQAVERLQSFYKKYLGG